MRRTSLAVGLVLLTTSTATACMWDYDTLRQERARFPGTLELITGKFLRHSKEFYQWRIEDRLRRLQSDPTNAALYDDLAVAYEKTGQNAKAIATMLKVEEFQPGRYETYSNLATFYFLGGQFQLALDTVNKALAINPDAHFGREKYQKYLTEYVISRLKDGKVVLPLEAGEQLGHSQRFASFLLNATQPKGTVALPDAETLAALKGVKGMMRFAYHDSPVLLEVLGDLLSGDVYSPNSDAKQLAARAYIKASMNVADQRAKDEYLKKARGVLAMQIKLQGGHEPIALEQVQAELAIESDDAVRWFDDLRNREIGWIRDGADPESEFDKLYDREPEVIGNTLFAEAIERLRKPESKILIAFVVFVAVSLLALRIVWIVVRRLVSRQKPPPAT